MAVIFVIVTVILQLATANPISNYKPLTKEGADRLDAWTPESKTPMWELSGQFQGDMVLTPAQRNGQTDPNMRWPTREIPYEISNFFSESEKRMIAQSLSSEYAKTCISPRPRTSEDRDYILIGGDQPGCFSYVGRVGGPQQLNLDRSGCLNQRTITHEFLHAVGFHHQHSVDGRDNYVDIIWQNIQRGMEQFFDIIPGLNSFGERYDYDSVMHYGRFAFSANQQPTIIPKDPSANIGQLNGLSRSDIIKVNKMFNCF